MIDKKEISVDVARRLFFAKVGEIPYKYDYETQKAIPDDFKVIVPATSIPTPVMDKLRWEIDHETIVEEVSTGKRYRMTARVPATESQGDLGDVFDGIELVEIELVTALNEKCLEIIDKTFEVEE